MDLTLEQFGIDRLSLQQRYELIGLIWDSLPDDTPFTPPDWHPQVVEWRVAAADADHLDAVDTIQGTTPTCGVCR